MKITASIMVIALSAISFNSWSQAGDKKEKELDKTQESERTRSNQGLRTDNELKDDRGEVQSSQYRNNATKNDSTSSNNDNSENNNSGNQGEVIKPNEDQGLGTDDDGNGLTNENNTTQGGEQGNSAPAVIQRTSSESGSPAVLSGDDGKKRDGTNNVQRATPNMAGAKEPGNMNLSEKNVGERNQNTGVQDKIRKQEEQPTRIPSKSETQRNKAKVAQQQRQDQQAGEVKETTTTGQEPTTAAPADGEEQSISTEPPKQTRKEKRKARRNRRNN